MDVDERPLERQILVAIDDIDRRVEALRTERATLQRLLVTTRKKTPGLPGTLRRNSADRIVIEEKVISLLREAERGMSGRTLFREIAYKQQNLKEATFRSYLHRMHTRGLIRPILTRGFWQLAAKLSNDGQIADVE
jgi:hypothetical protein